MARGHLRHAPRRHEEAAQTRAHPDPRAVRGPRAQAPGVAYEGRLFDRAKEPTAAVRRLWAENEPTTRRDNKFWQSDLQGSSPKYLLTPGARVITSS